MPPVPPSPCGRQEGPGHTNSNTLDERLHDNSRKDLTSSPLFKRGNVDKTRGFKTARRITAGSCLCELIVLPAAAWCVSFRAPVRILELGASNTDIKARTGRTAPNKRGKEYKAGNSPAVEVSRPRIEPIAKLKQVRKARILSVVSPSEARGGNGRTVAGR
ncbi:hypothetical protein BV22DRAFT_1043143 [Leucogyrophana mollusca]|uniref:Uncharacterized protein n=1 Tax=Leucogyrophana mollusca TaxID=85980 RepID=A0ACB8C0W7_9AGAM|nr:hypothetical protein BV22DRAFT_1043143 [Leucogyrophana mollusca]